MSSKVGFEWYIGEEEYPRWRGVVSEMTGMFPSSAERQLLHRTLQVLAATMIVIVAASAAGLSSLQLDHMLAEEGIRHSLALETQAWRTHDRELYRALIDSQVGDGWIGLWRDRWGARDNAAHKFELHLATVRRLDSLIQAEIVVTQPKADWWGVYTHRERRYYRDSSAGWVRTLPPAGFWGEPRTLETQFLRFIYYMPDAQAVASIADRIDSAYPRLRQILELEAPSTEEKLTIRVIPDMIRNWSWRSGKLDVTSPHLAQIEEGTSDADYLGEFIMGRLINQAVWSGSIRSSSRNMYRWAFPLTGVRGWLLADLAGFEDPWRTKGLEVFRTHGIDRFPLRLTDVIEFEGEGRPPREEIIWHYMAAESVIGYVVNMYGYERLPELLRGFAEYDTWQGLIPAVFESTPENFTAGWNRYLTEHYGLSE